MRDLELANREKASLLRAALLDRHNLPPELLELKRVETIRQMHERIDAVIKAPLEVQPKVLDTTSIEIAETVLSSEAALDQARKVSIRSMSYNKLPSSPFDAAVSSKRKKHRLESSLSASTLMSPVSPRRYYIQKNRSVSDISTSTSGSRQTAWSRAAAALLQSEKTREPIHWNSSNISVLASNGFAASLSLTRLHRSIFMFSQFSFSTLPQLSLFINRLFANAWIGVPRTNFDQ